MKLTLFGPDLGDPLNKFIQTYLCKRYEVEVCLLDREMRLRGQYDSVLVQVCGDGTSFGIVVALTESEA